ncbi:hypothetical protein AMTRI_Chr02g224530 [Amborella trichopoda]
MDTLWELLSGNDNAGQEGPVFPQSTSSVWRLYYQTTSLCCPMFIVLDSARECPKTPFDLSFCHFYFSLSLSLSLSAQSSFSPQSCGLKLYNHRHLAILIRESHSPLDKSVASMD